MINALIKVLLVEDNPGDVLLLQEFLQDVTSTQFELTPVESLKEALACLARHSFDIVLLDLSLPDSQGLETFVNIYRCAPLIPIVVLTGLDDETVAMKAMQEGAQDYIVKGQVDGHLTIRAIRYAIERKQAQEILQQQKEMLQTIFDNIPVMLTFYDADGCIQLVNKAFETTLGWSSEELKKIDILRECYPDPNYRASAIAFMQTANGTWRDFHTRNRSGEILETSWANVRLPSGFHVGIGQDITERKRAEQKIYEQAALLEITTNAIIVRDRENRIIFWNKGAEQLYGWSAPEALEKNATELLFKEVTPQLELVIKTVVEQGEWQGELQQVAKNGKEVIVESRWTLVRDETEQPKSILSVDTDITEKKYLELQILRAQRLESLGTLASGIAHDLNNILTPILTTAQLLPLKHPDLDERSMQLLRLLEGSAKRGADLVKQILSFARGVEGKRTCVQVGHLLWEVVKIAKSTFPKSIEIEADIPMQEMGRVFADATNLHQVFMNLFVNARDAMPDGGKLIVSARNVIIDDNYVKKHLDARVGRYLAITISDTGMGMSPEVLDRIFEPFFTTKEVGKGTGLGLSTSLGIVKSYGGFIIVSSEVGVGSTFKVYLPQVDEVQQSVETESEMPRGNGELILVVDDEVSVREITKTSLEINGYQVLLASDGIEAIALYTRHQDKIKAVLMDIMMPSMNGMTAIRTLQTIDPNVRVIATSGLVSNEIIARTSVTNIQAFLSKPYMLKDLLNVLGEVIIR